MAATEEALRSAGSTRSDERAEPVDYAAINAVYPPPPPTLLHATRERAAGAPSAVRELAPLPAATFALSKVIARERVGPGVREPFVDQDGPPPQPTGRRLQRAIGELVTCTRCVGA